VVSAPQLGNAIKMAPQDGFAWNNYKDIIGVGFNYPRYAWSIKAKQLIPPSHFMGAILKIYAYKILFLIIYRYKYMHIKSYLIYFDEYFQNINIL
jgi:hypothetical protein